MGKSKSAGELLDTILPPEMRQQLTKLHRLQYSLEHVLPEPLRHHVRAAGIENGELRLVADSGVWATQLRYQQQQVLKQLSAATGARVTRMQVRIDRAPPETIRPRRHRPRIDAESRRVLEEAARTTRDPVLASLYRRLIRRSARDERMR